MHGVVEDSEFAGVESAGVEVSGEVSVTRKAKLVIMCCYPSAFKLRHNSECLARVSVNSSPGELVAA